MSVTTSDKRSWKFFAVRLAAKGLLALLFFASYATALHAQTIHIELVNGKTGRPITDRSLLNVWVGHENELTLEIPTDKHGVALLRLTHNDNEINVPDCRGMHADREKLRINSNKKDEKEFNKKYKWCTGFEADNPIVRHADSISVRTLPGDISWKVFPASSIGYVECWNNTSAWFVTTDFSTEDILKHGIVTVNACGKATASPQPGHLVLFVRLPSNKEYWDLIN